MSVKRRKGPYVVEFSKPWVGGPTPTTRRFTSRYFSTIREALAFAHEKELGCPKVVEAKVAWKSYRDAYTRMESR